eukprot:NODE_627_length_1901_cov_13.079374_g503_i0.p1 GENE.NODE_627_length_1901_cov_13.079374_g503_i0~~NODE_627_length_1901_cov_13.079374_g503_i0.p1  ORF type:complete len:565 (+),score=124.57 NODE_627_length_1901_cov_13.079374_g503_i0:190-1884(+)
MHQQIQREVAFKLETIRPCQYVALFAFFICGVTICVTFGILWGPTPTESQCLGWSRSVGQEQPNMTGPALWRFLSLRRIAEFKPECETMGRVQGPNATLVHVLDQEEPETQIELGAKEAEIAFPPRLVLFRHLVSLSQARSLTINTIWRFGVFLQTAHNTSACGQFIFAFRALRQRADIPEMKFQLKYRDLSCAGANQWCSYERLMLAQGILDRSSIEFQFGLFKLTSVLNDEGETEVTAQDASDIFQSQVSVFYESNPEFAIFELCFRYLLLLFTLAVLLFYLRALRQVPKHIILSYEQHCITVLLLATLFLDNPFLIGRVLSSHLFFSIVDVLSTVTFCVTLLGSLLLLVDGILVPLEQRRFVPFLLPKMALLASLWGVVVLLYVWYIAKAVQFPYGSDITDVPFYQYALIIVLCLLFCYLNWILFLLARIVAQWNDLPYYTTRNRFKILTVLSIFMVLFTGFGILTLVFYSAVTAATVAGVYAANNFYVAILAYALSPRARTEDYAAGYTRHGVFDNDDDILQEDDEDLEMLEDLPCPRPTPVPPFDYSQSSLQVPGPAAR